MVARRSCLLLSAVAIANMAVSPALAQSSATYQYDALGRLVRVTYPSGAFAAYGYDAADNRVFMTMSLTANNLPVANPDGALPGGPISVAASGATTIDVLANDTDADNDVRSVYQVSNGAKGTASSVSGGTLVAYTPTSGQTGLDTFSYSIIDARGGVSAPTTVQVNIAGNHAPVAQADSTSTPYNTPLSGYNPLSNDSDEDNDPLTIVAATQPPTGKGSTTFTASTVSYTPATGVTGQVSFNYTISDGKGGQHTATITVTVGAQANRNPVANYFGTDDWAFSYNSPATNYPLTNDYDPDGDSLQITNVWGSTKGTSSFTSTSITYTPQNQSGQDYLYYTISDGRGGTAQGTISIAIAPQPNIAPVAVNDPGYVTPYLTPITIPVTNNDYDPTGDTFYISDIDTTGTYGQAYTANNSSAILFSPAAGFSGPTGFSYRLRDSRGWYGNWATVSVNVQAPVGPTASLSSYSYYRTYNTGTQTWDNVPNIQVTVAGGVAPYTYLWTRNPGGDTGTNISSTTGNTVSWTHVLSPFPQNTELPSTWSVTVTDANGQQHTPAPVSVTVVKGCSTC